MIRLRDKDTDTDLGEISEEDLAFLQDQLEEESADDTDYYINRDEVEIWKQGGAAPSGLISLLEQALSDREGVEVEWVEE
jgi:hypothetical protein